MGHQRDRGPPPHGEDGHRRDHCGDTCREIPLGAGGEGLSSSDDEDVADSLMFGMNRHGVGKLETRFIGEFADRVYGNVTDGYLEAGGGMVQNVTVDHLDSMWGPAGCCGRGCESNGGCLTVHGEGWGDGLWEMPCRVTPSYRCS